MDKSEQQTEYDHHQYTALCHHCNADLWADSTLGRIGNKVSHWLRHPTHVSYGNGEVWSDAK